MDSNSILPPSLRLQHLWPVRDRVEQQKRLTQAALDECERVAHLLGLNKASLEEEVRYLLAHPEIAPEFTPEQIEVERQVMYKAAMDQCNKIGKPFEDVKPAVDALINSIIDGVKVG